MGVRLLLVSPTTLVQAGSQVREAAAATRAGRNSHRDGMDDRAAGDGICARARSERFVTYYMVGMATLAIDRG